MLICVYFHQAWNPLLQKIQVYPLSRDHVGLDKKLLPVPAPGRALGLPPQDAEFVHCTIPGSTAHMTIKWVALPGVM